MAETEKDVNYLVTTFCRLKRLLLAAFSQWFQGLPEYTGLEDAGNFSLDCRQVAQLFEMCAV
jgi:hypothetical protein